MNVRNALIFTEDGNLFVRKPNGLEYEFQNVDRPELGFEYDVLVYDDIEVKVVKWNSEVNFDMQEKSDLSPDEKDMIEQYIANSEPPLGVNLNNQLMSKLNNRVNDFLKECIDIHGFTDLTEVTFAGREGSNHPCRSNARRVMEYGDALFNILDQICAEIKQTREDILKEYEEYEQHIPIPTKLPDHQQR
tara:strand:+ start:714 stop:1283 length:570 start_codon:yes stop_codon:yes gene_type:complete